MTGSVWLRLRDHRLEIDARRPLVMGIVNATPDSFSDGTGAATAQQSLARARQLVAAGADLVDVGGESQRTDRPPVSETEEAERVCPVIAALASEGVLVSVDTYKPGVAQAALEAGAAMVNDVSGLAEPQLARLCAESKVGLVVCHTRAAPKQKRFPDYADVVEDVVSFLGQRIEQAMRLGVDSEQVVIDPGPDLAKTPAETVAVLRNLPSLGRFGRPLLLAVSRKDFIGAICKRPPRERLAGTLAALAELSGDFSTIARVHDVGAVRDFLAVRAALRGDSEVADSLHLQDGLRREPQR